MANDIANCFVSPNTIKNGSSIIYCSKTGLYQTLNTSVSNKPVIGDIDDKYDNRFYNGTFVTVLGSIDGGGA